SRSAGPAWPAGQDSRPGPGPGPRRATRLETQEEEPKMSPSTVIETHGLTKTFKGVQALKSLDLQVGQNSICGFLGPNGAGKTTTIKLLLGLARPTSGSGRVFGKDIETENDEIRRRVGYLSQDPRYYEYMTARET